MKFFNVLALLPLALVAALPAIDINANVIGNSISADLPDIDGLAVLSNLIQSGKIQLTDTPDEIDTRSLSARANVPGLHCGYTRAALCALNAGGVVAQCIWAVIDQGIDVGADGRCVAAVGGFTTNFPNDCRLCLGL